MGVLALALPFVPTDGAQWALMVLVHLGFFLPFYPPDPII